MKKEFLVIKNNKGLYLGYNNHKVDLIDRFDINKVKENFYYSFTLKKELEKIRIWSNPEPVVIQRVEWIDQKPFLNLYHKGSKNSVLKSINLSYQDYFSIKYMWGDVFALRVFRKINEKFVGLEYREELNIFSKKLKLSSLLEKKVKLSKKVKSFIIENKDKFYDYYKSLLNEKKEELRKINLVKSSKFIPNSVSELTDLLLTEGVEDLTPSEYNPTWSFTGRGEDVFKIGDFIFRFVFEFINDEEYKIDYIESGDKKIYNKEIIKWLENIVSTYTFYYNNSVASLDEVLFEMIFPKGIELPEFECKEVISKRVPCEPTGNVYAYGLKEMSPIPEEKEKAIKEVKAYMENYEKTLKPDVKVFENDYIRVVYKQKITCETNFYVHTKGTGVWTKTGWSDDGMRETQAEMTVVIGASVCGEESREWKTVEIENKKLNEAVFNTIKKFIIK